MCMKFQFNLVIVFMCFLLDGRVAAENPVAWKLANGLTVALVQVENHASVEIQFWFRAGSKYEPKEKQGLAYAVAALQNSGSKYVKPNQAVKFIENLGGIRSFSVADDTVVFKTTLAKQYLDFGLQLEAERIENMFHDTHELQMELKALGKVEKTRGKTDLALSEEAFLQKAFENTETSRSLGGTHLKSRSRSSRLSIKGILDFYHAHYHPGRALLVVVGDVDPLHFRKIVQKKFSIKKHRKIAHPLKTKSVEKKQFYETKENDAEIRTRLWGYRVPSESEKKIVALKVWAEILGGGVDSMLQRRLNIIEKNLGYTFSKLVSRETATVMIVGVSGYKKAVEGKIENVLRDVFMNLMRNGVLAKDIKRAKQRLLSEFAFSTRHTSGVANTIGQHWVQRGEVKDIQSLKTEIMTVDEDFLLEVANELFFP